MPIQDYTEFFGEDFEDIIDQLEEEFPEQVETILDEIITLMLFDSEIFAVNIEKQLRTLRTSGVDEGQIEDILQKDMDEEGKIFGALKNTIIASIVLGVAQSARQGQYESYDMEQLFTWVTVSGHRICDDCETRAGETLTFSEWEALGLPGSGWSVCGSYCYCLLDPTGSVTSQIQLPTESTIREKTA